MGVVIDLTGSVFGKLTVLSRALSGTRHRTKWNCRCECGKEVAVMASNLQKGTSTTCGCGKGSHHQSRTAEYKIWLAMKARCSNPRNARFHRYGGRGISVCRQWEDSFEVFIRDMGDRPSGLSIDRINNDGNYEPGNCRWASRKDQQRNMRSNRTITVNGQTKTVAEWSEQLGLRPNTVITRLRRGWSNEKALELI